MIRIKSKRAGFRRCRVAHPADWTEYPDDRFTDAEIETFQAEPMLSVEIVEEESGDKGAAADEEKTAKSAKSSKGKGKGK